jgi:hypothetical protein
MEFLYAAQMKSSTVQGVQGLVIRLCGVIQAVLAINASRQIAEGRATISASWISFSIIARACRYRCSAPENRVVQGDRVQTYTMPLWKQET